MKRFFIIAAAFILCCCAGKGDGKRGTDVHSGTGQTAVSDSIVYLQKRSLTGDFDGDGKTDTIRQDVINRKTRKSIASFRAIEWDSIENYFDRIDAEVILTFNDRRSDALLIGTGGGLYCLINLGDNNRDGKDEIAFVLNNYSFTNISNCQVYTLCAGQWQEVTSFKIHQRAFDYEEGESPNPNQIKGFLEFRKNKWHYIDYETWFNAETDRDTVLRPLKIKTRC